MTLIKEDADETIQRAQFAEELIDYFKNTNSGEREKAYFEKMLDLKYENECLKRENQELKAENRTLKAKLEKAYDFMRQFTINGMNMLEHFLRSIGEWVQQKVAGVMQKLHVGHLARLCESFLKAGNGCDIIFSGI